VSGSLTDFRQRGSECSLSFPKTGRKSGVQALFRLNRVAGTGYCRRGSLLVGLVELLGKSLSNALFYHGDEGVTHFEGVTRLVADTGLNLIPACAQGAQRVFGEERACFSMVASANAACDGQIVTCGGSWNRLAAGRNRKENWR
jgi:hypothetical protein